MEKQLPDGFPTPQIPRVSMGMVLSSVSAVLNLERGLFFTIKELVRAPGEAIRTYLFVDRSRYYDPLKFLVVSVTLYLFVSFTYFPDTGFFGGLEQGAKGGTDEAEVSLLFTYIKDYANLLILFSVPIASAFSWWLFRRMGMNFVEHFVINAFLYGQLTLAGLLLLPFDGGVGITLVYVGYFTYFLRSLYGFSVAKAFGYSLLLNVVNAVLAMFFLLVCIFAIAFFVVG